MVRGTIYFGVADTDLKFLLPLVVHCEALAKDFILPSFHFLEKIMPHKFSVKTSLK